MRSPEGALTPQTGMPARLAERMQGGCIKRFVVGHGGQDSGQASCKHAFACTRMTDEQQVMSPGGRDFEGAAGPRLASDVSQIEG